MILSAWVAIAPLQQASALHQPDGNFATVKSILTLNGKRIDWSENLIGRANSYSVAPGSYDTNVNNFRYSVVVDVTGGRHENDDGVYEITLVKLDSVSPYSTITAEYVPNLWIFGESSPLTCSDPNNRLTCSGYANQVPVPVGVNSGMVKTGAQNGYVLADTGETEILSLSVSDGQIKSAFANAQDIPFATVKNANEGHLFFSATFYLQVNYRVTKYQTDLLGNPMEPKISYGHTKVKVRTDDYIVGVSYDKEEASISATGLFALEPNTEGNNNGSTQTVGNLFIDYVSSILGISSNEPDEGAIGIGAIQDSDGDGIKDYLDTDVDGDGTLNIQDQDIDGDGILNNVDSDDDGDKIADELDSSLIGYVGPQAPTQQSSMNLVMVLIGIAVVVIGFSYYLISRRKQYKR